MTMRECMVCGKPCPASRRTCSKECGQKLMKSVDYGVYSEEPIPCKVCGTLSHYTFCGYSCVIGYIEGTWNRELYEWPDDKLKLSTADLIRKWHREGMTPEEIANMLCRDINVVREVLNEDTGSPTAGHPAGNTCGSL